MEALLLELFYNSNYNAAIAVDENIRTLGIPILSKCVCCSLPKLESASHLFVQGDLAKEVWCSFSSIQHVNSGHSGIHSTLSAWFEGNSFRSLLGAVPILFVLNENTTRFHSVPFPPLTHPGIRGPRILCSLQNAEESVTKMRKWAEEFSY